MNIPIKDSVTFHLLGQITQKLSRIAFAPLHPNAIPPGTLLNSLFHNIYIPEKLRIKNLPKQSAFVVSINS